MSLTAQCAGEDRPVFAKNASPIIQYISAFCVCPLVTSFDLHVLQSNGKQQYEYEREAYGNRSYVNC